MKVMSKRKLFKTQETLDCWTNSPSLSTIGNEQRTVRRTCILMLGCKGLR